MENNQLHGGHFNGWEPSNPYFNLDGLCLGHTFVQSMPTTPQAQRVTPEVLSECITM